MELIWEMSREIKKSDATHFLCEEETPTIPIIMLIDGFSAIFALYQLSWEVEKLYFAFYLLESEKFSLDWWLPLVLLIPNPSQEYSIFGPRLVFLSSCHCVLQGVRKGEGESGVASRLHGFEGAAEVGEGAHRLCGVDL